MCGRPNTAGYNEIRYLVKKMEPVRLRMNIITCGIDVHHTQSNFHFINETTNEEFYRAEGPSLCAHRSPLKVQSCPIARPHLLLYKIVLICLYAIW